MKLVYSLCLLLFISAISYSQENLVVNPSFEEGIPIKSGAYQIKKGKKLIKSWDSPHVHTPYLFVTPKKSVAVANSGYASVGMTLGSGKVKKTKFDYITGKLVSPLEKDQTYCICFNILLHRSSKWAATDVGVLLHNDQDLLSKLPDPNSLNANLYANGGAPVINTKWKRYCGYYRAIGGEQYLSFGKFGKSEAVKMKDLGLDPYFELEYPTEAFYQLDDFSVSLLTTETDCGCAEKPPKPEEITESKPSYPPYLFALDASGSMKRDGLFDSLRVNLIRFIKGLPYGTHVSLVTFSGFAKEIFSGELSESTPATIDSLLSRASVGGGTSVLLGLQAAYESRFTETPDSAKMVLVSDGEFNVSTKIVDLIRNEYETRGRKLTLMQIGARAIGLEQIKPYMDNYIYTNASELSQAVSQLNKPIAQIKDSAVACDCEEEYSDIMNYHFVIDYSGSMKNEKNRAIMALRYLFDQAPDNAMISVTSFNTRAEQLYVGKKTDITMLQLTGMLMGTAVGGGTNPVPGVEHALKLAKGMSEGRFSHMILITDLGPGNLSRQVDLGQLMQTNMKEFDLAGCAITVDENGIVATHSQVDETTGNFVGVGKIKFERDLFQTQRSSCDYTSQPYHYSPGKAYLKTQTKRSLLNLMMSLLKIKV